MENKSVEDLRYPIGTFNKPEPITPEDLQGYINVIEELPGRLRTLVANLSEEQLNTEYRPDGWTVKQVIHHIADSHVNAYIRFKLALTEDTPTVKPYFEDKWAKLGDYKLTPIDVSLSLIDSIHARWINLLKSMDEKDFEMSFFHPEHGKEFSLDESAGMYAWHCSHHYAHIAELKKRKNW